MFLPVKLSALAIKTNVHLQTKHSAIAAYHSHHINVNLMVSHSGRRELGFNSPLPAPLDMFQLDAATTFGSERISASVEKRQETNLDITITDI